MSDDTKVVISMENYQHLKACQKNLEKIQCIFKSDEYKDIKDDCARTKEDFWHNIIIPIYDKSNMFSRLSYKEYNDYVIK